MKILSTLTALSLAASIASTPAHADKRRNIQALKSGATFTTATITGIALGGPVGMVVGAVSGIYFGEQGKKNVERTIELEQKTMSLTQMETSLNESEREVLELEKMIAEKMQFQLYFKTGDDILAEDDAKQLEAISDFLLDNDYMHIVVDGHTDPRGSDEYNNILSEERANSVADILEKSGVHTTRISTKAHGSRFSTAEPGDLLSYAKERRVKVQILPAQGSSDLAAID